MTTERYDFERYLNVRMAYSPNFSPDGQRLSFLTDITGVAEVWSVPVDMYAQTPAWPDQLTFRNERVADASYSPVADVLLVSADIGGSERTQLYTLAADGSSLTALTAQPGHGLDLDQLRADAARLLDHPGSPTEGLAELFPVARNGIGRLFVRRQTCCLRYRLPDAPPTCLSCRLLPEPERLRRIRLRIEAAVG